MKWQPGECHPGEMIRVRIGSIWHYGIFISEEEVIAFGLPPVPAYRSDPMREKVCATDIDVFSCGKIVETAVFDRTERKKMYTPEEIVLRARARLGQSGYDLIHNNCEHFANECVFGEKRSLQQEDALRHWKNRPICNIYLSGICRDLPSGTLHPPERAAEIRNCTHPELKQAKTAAWLLLQYAARHCFGLDYRDLKYTMDGNGRWSCEQFDFSLSHTESFVAVSVSNAPIGIDIGELATFSGRFSSEQINTIRSRYFTRAERSRFTAEAEPFLVCWTRKEAAFKCKGKATFKPRAFDALRMKGHTFRIPELNDLIVSVSGENAVQPHLYLINGTASQLLNPVILSP